jgi:hypothetical protein
MNNQKVSNFNGYVIALYLIKNSFDYKKDNNFIFIFKLTILANNFYNS